MKRVCRFLEMVVAVVSATLVLACSVNADYAPPMDENMNNPDGEYITAFGVLSSSYSTITTDANVMLFISEIGEQTSVEELESRRGRVMFNYTILGNNPAGGFFVRLNRFYPLVVKDMEVFTPEDKATRSSTPSGGAWLEDENFTSILDAPYMPFEASVGGGYINVNVCYLSTKSESEEVPDVDLYYDTVVSTADTAVFQLVGDEEEEMYEEGAVARFQWFSFRIVEQMEEALQGVNLYAFYWRWWENQDEPLLGTKEYTSVLNNDTVGGGATGRVMAFSEL